MTSPTRALQEQTSAWSCHERNRAECRNPDGCHCREITSLLARIDAKDAEIASKSEQIGKLYKVCNERDVLRNLLSEAELALRAFSAHCTYPVAQVINKRGYTWRGEDALDYAKELSDSVLAKLKAAPGATNESG